jgi:hypothetical protein
MAEQRTARSALEQHAAGTAKRPRGNAVLPEEHGASAPFAKACQRMVQSSALNAYRNRSIYLGADEEDEAPVAVIPAPSEALPPLP